MAIGAGLYLTGIVFTGIIFLAQIILHKDSKLLMVRHMKILKVSGVAKQGYIRELTRTLAVHDVVIDDYDVSRNSENDNFDYVITVEVPKTFDEEAILSLIEYDASLETMK